jgi:hypothetical protein
MYITAMKTKNSRKRISICLLLGVSLAVLPFYSCASMIKGAISSDGSAELMVVDAALQPRMTSLIRTLTSATSAAGQTDEPILNGAVITQSILNAPGVTYALLKNTSQSSAAGVIQITNINEFLSFMGSNKFIVFDQTSKRCQINIDRENALVMLSLLSPEITGYLNALMAPVATGENMSKSEYLELIAMFYSKAISDEIAASQIRISAEFPGIITSVKGGIFSGKQANFDIPLLDILVLEVPLSFEVRWN